MGNTFRTKSPKPPAKRSLADKVSSVIGSWIFISCQATVLAFWVFWNTLSPMKWDAPPHILLNLLLSFQAAFTGPVLLMASNRQGEIDRRRDIDHYLIDVYGNQMIEEMAMQLEELHKHVEHCDEEHY